jgi:putative transposase
MRSRPTHGPQGRGYMKNRQFPRRPPRLRNVNTGNGPVYLVTFCTHRRKSWLAQGKVHVAFVEFATRAELDFNIAVGRYVIMPDHIHLFVTSSIDFDLARWVGALKQNLARAASQRGSDGQIWQEGFFDHLLRNEEGKSQKWDYVFENPARAGLVVRSEDWPYQGQIVPIDHT